MRDLKWRREDQINELRDRIWKYFTPAAQVESLRLDAAALLQLSDHDVMTLARVEFLLSDPVAELIKVLPSLARRLTTTTTNFEERSTERIRGSIRWPETIHARNETQMRNLYVSNPVERAFETPENLLLAYVLDQIIDLGSQSGWDTKSSELGLRVKEVVSEARRWRSSRMLLQIHSQLPGDRLLSRVRAGRARNRYSVVLEVFDLHEKVIGALDRMALRSLVEGAGLTTGADSTLFELLCTFRIIEVLNELGWETSPIGLFGGELKVDAKREEERLALWYQSAPRGMRDGSQYAAMLKAHGFNRASDLRPDLVLHRKNDQDSRWLVVECKMGTSRGVNESARAALLDLLAYRESFRASLDAAPVPYGLGVAWGEDLAPATGSEIMLCTPDHLLEAISVIAS